MHGIEEEEGRSCTMVAVTGGGIFARATSDAAASARLASRMRKSSSRKRSSSSVDVSKESGENEAGRGVSPPPPDDVAAVKGDSPCKSPREGDDEVRADDTFAAPHESRRAMSSATSVVGVEGEGPRREESSEDRLGGARAAPALCPKRTVIGLGWILQLFNTYVISPPSFVKHYFLCSCHL